MFNAVYELEKNSLVSKRKMSIRTIYRHLYQPSSEKIPLVTYAFFSSSYGFLAYVADPRCFFSCGNGTTRPRRERRLRIYDGVKFTKHTAGRDGTVRDDEPDPGLCRDRLDLTVLEHVKLHVPSVPCYHRYRYRRI